MALIAILAVVLAMTAQLRPSSTGSWQFRLEVASVRLSLSSVETPVRNRTALFEIGQVLMEIAF